jgi:hypothetical protein
LQPPESIATAIINKNILIGMSENKKESARYGLSFLTSIFYLLYELMYVFKSSMEDSKVKASFTIK